MATLQIEATPKDGLQRYALTVDGANVPMGADDTGEIEVEGACGDQSLHRIAYTLFGPAGAKLNVAIACGGASIGATGDIEVYPEGEPHAAGWQDFQL